MTGESLDLTDIEARDAGLITEAWSAQAAADRRALLAEVKRLRAQLAAGRTAAQNLVDAAPTALAEVWDEGYRNGYSIGYNDNPAALTNYQNPYRTQPEEIP